MRRDILEDESNAERWMISYADFITLLFAFFVVMYAISSVNDEKYKVLSDTLAKAFDAEPQSPNPLEVGQPSTAASPHVVDVPDSTGWADTDLGDTQMRDLEERISKRAGYDAEGGVVIRADNDWVEIKLATDLFFAAGSAALSNAATGALEELLPMLDRHDHGITVEGYTDNVPTATQSFPSNWELSAARASAVARALIDLGLRPRRFAAIGYGENHSIATNATPGGRAENRRVVIVVARKAELSRNRNSEHRAAVVGARETQNQTLKSQRTTEGGLIFTDETLDVNSSNSQTTQEE